MRAGVRARHLVQGVGPDAKAQKKGKERGGEAIIADGRGEGGPQRDITQMPERVRRVQQRHVVAPATTPSE